jgi:hypothetical protein
MLEELHQWSWCCEALQKKPSKQQNLTL